MARNRKNGAAPWLVPGAKAALLCVLLGGSAIGYVYQKNQLVELGRQIQKAEQQYKAVTESNARLTRSLAVLQSTVYLENRVKELKLGLVQPTQSQILTIVEMPAGSVLAPKSQPLFAQNSIAPLGRK